MVVIHHVWICPTHKQRLDYLQVSFVSCVRLVRGKPRMQRTNQTRCHGGMHRPLEHRAIGRVLWNVVGQVRLEKVMVFLSIAKRILRAVGFRNEGGNTAGSRCCVRLF